MQILGLDDSKKIGMFLMLISIISFTLGVVLLFERPLIIIGNICFLVGMYFFVGISGSLTFFRKKGKIKGSFLYFLGLILIFMRYTFLGTILQFIGFFIIFKSFLPDIYDYICKIPILGKHLKSYALQNFLDNISTGNKSARI